MSTAEILYTSIESYSIKFKDALKQLNPKSLNDMKTIIFDRNLDLHRKMMNYVLRLMLKQDITTQNDWKLTGFQNSSEMLHFFQNNNTVILLLLLLFLSEFESDLLLPSQNTKNTLESLSKISEIISNSLNPPDLKSFFIYSLAIFQSIRLNPSDPLLTQDISHTLSSNHLKEYLNELTLRQIKSS
jgi:hypothetical protein